MHISPSMQVSNSSQEGNSHESARIEGASGNSSSPWAGKAQKNTRLGIFAKLLEGLISREKSGSINSNITELKDLDNSGKVGTEKTEQKNQKAGQNSKITKNSGLESGNLDEKGVSNMVFAFLKQDVPVDSSQNHITGMVLEENVAHEALLRTGSNDFHSLQKGKGAAHPKEGTQPETNLQKENVTGLSMEKSGGKNEIVRVITLNPEEKEHVKSRLQNSGERIKNQARPDFQFNAAAENSFLNSGSRTSFTVMQRPESIGKEEAKPGEARGRKGRERSFIEVRDLRTSSDSTTRTDTAMNDVTKGQMFNQKMPFGQEIDLSLELKPEKALDEASGKARLEPAVSRGFEDALARELRGDLSTDIVRDALLIIRNGGEGSIRLSLQPASLGDVKIRLEMTENKITGHIIVESSEALRAFERELPVLEKAFRDSGFSETNLEMSLKQDGQNFSSQEQRQEGNPSGVAPVFAASRYEAEADWVETSSAEGSATSPGRIPVNLLV